ncbi:MAG: hypothetical protein R3F43_10175 [bacterium]
MHTEVITRRDRRGVPLLYYWRGDVYRADLDAGVGFHLNQGHAAAARHRRRRQPVGVCSRRADGAYVLVAELAVVHARTLNPDGFHYGRYRLWGHLARSRYRRGRPGRDITRRSAVGQQPGRRPRAGVPGRGGRPQPDARGPRRPGAVRRRPAHRAPRTAAPRGAAEAVPEATAPPPSSAFCWRRQRRRR